MKNLFLGDEIPVGFPLPFQEVFLDIESPLSGKTLTLLFPFGL
jgi:hypothetical protein